MYFENYRLNTGCLGQLMLYIFFFKQLLLRLQQDLSEKILGTTKSFSLRRPGTDAEMHRCALLPALRQVQTWICHRKVSVDDPGIQLSLFFKEGRRFRSCIYHHQLLGMIILPTETFIEQGMETMTREAGGGHHADQGLGSRSLENLENHP